VQDELQKLWQNVTPETQVLLQDGAVALVALVGGHFLGAIIARALRAKNFDAALRLPGSPPPLADANGFTPTFVAGMLVRLTVWALAGWWLANKYGRADIAHTLGVIINRTWGISAALVAALALGSLLARRLMDCLNGLPKTAADAARPGHAASHQNAAAAVGAGAYVLATLLVLLIAADLFDWPLTRNSALALWQFTQHMLIAVAALFLGCLGARWARDLATPDGAASPEKRAGQYTALAIMAATTILSVVVLLASAGVLLSLATLVILGVGLWMVRGHIPDVVAGLQLKANKVREVFFEGQPWQVAEVGFLTSQVGRAGEFCRVQNRVVLEARMHAPVPQAVPR
jgi:hypothetical protein